MKIEVFNQYVDKVSSMYSIEKSEMLSKSRKKELVDARHLLYYLCWARQMPIYYIQKYLKEQGLEINHSVIINGISSVKKKIAKDSDYLVIIKNIEKSIIL